MQVFGLDIDTYTYVGFFIGFSILLSMGFGCIKAIKGCSEDSLVKKDKKR